MANGICIVKWVLNIFNAILIISGIFVTYFMWEFIKVLPAEYISYAYIIGALNILCGLFGFLGIVKENVCITKAYAIIMFISIIVQFTGMCFVSKFDKLIKENAQQIVETQWHKEMESEGAMGGLQLRFKCCGNDSSNDYLNILQRSHLPKTCYSSFFIAGATLYTEGCYFAVEKRIYKAFGVSRSSDWIAMLITCVLFVLSVHLVIHFMHKKRREGCQH